MDVKNVGERAGEETVQLYVHETYAPVSLPVKQLRGFERVALKPGETKTVTLTLTPEDLQLLNIDMHWRVVPRRLRDHGRGGRRKIYRSGER